MILGFILGVLVTSLIFVACMWLMRPDEFKALMRSLGVGGELPDEDDETNKKP